MPGKQHVLDCLFDQDVYETSEILNFLMKRLPPLQKRDRTKIRPDVHIWFVDRLEPNQTCVVGREEAGLVNVSGHFSCGCQQTFAGQATVI